jgi:hypothetical protein
MHHQTVSNATIQVGSTTPVPEFNLGLEITVFAARSIFIEGNYRSHARTIVKEMIAGDIGCVNR